MGSQAIGLMHWGSLMMAPPTQDDDDDDPGDDDDNMVMFGLHPTQTPKNLNRCFLKNPSFMSLTLSAASLRIRYIQCITFISDDLDDEIQQPFQTH